MTLAIHSADFISHYTRNCRWSADGYGPMHYNCYGLICDIYNLQWGIRLQRIMITAEMIYSVIRTIKSELKEGPWEKIDKPEHGCLVVFANHTEPLHVGVWMCYDGGGVLHACKRFNITYMDILKMRASGFVNPEYYRYVDGKR